MGSSSVLKAVGGLGEPGTASHTHRRARQPLQTSEATVTLQSPLASLSSFSFVTSGALRALEIRQTDTGWVGSGGAGQEPSAGLIQAKESRNHSTRCPPSLPLRDPAQDAQVLTGIPRAPAGPAGPMGPCAPCEETMGAVSEPGQARDGPPLYLPLGWAPRLLFPRYSQLLLGLPVCQLGQRGQESRGAQGLREHPGAQSHHDHPVRREVSGSKKNGSEEERKKDPSRVTQDSDPNLLP